MAMDVALSATNAEPLSADEIIRLSKQYTLYEWVAQNAADPIAVATAKGSYFYTADGRRFLDFNSQSMSVNIGHGDQRVIDAIAGQAQRLAFTSPFLAHEPRARLGRKLAELTPGDLDVTFFTNAGADANENAIRLARLHTGRDKVVSHYRSYHGNTGAAVVATGDWRRVGNEYARGHVHVFGPYLYRSEFWASTVEEEGERALRHLERVIQSEGPDTVAAILLESVPGTAGVLVPPPGYLAGVRAIADRYGIVLILDEVMVGFGRTGTWFAFEHAGVRPDLITFAKGVNSGYVPAGGVVISDEIAATFDDRVFPGGLTYSGHPLAMAAIVATLDVMQRDDVVGNAARIGADVLGPGLAELADRHPCVGDVRGLGVFWAVELVRDRTTREPVSPVVMASVKRAALARGLLPFLAENRIHVAPPCVVTADEVREGLAVLDEVLAEVDALVA
jgi:taurine--2-oxoglutarate transaminase